MSSSEDEVQVTRRSGSVRQAAKKVQAFNFDSDDDAAVSSDDVAVVAPSKPKAKAKAKPKAAPKTKVESEEEETSEQDEGEEVKSKQTRVKTPKEELISELLCRWWYVLPDWPPADFDFNAELKRRGLRVVELDDWEDAKEEVGGFGKCYGLSQFPGVYRDSKGQLHDCRPEQGKPSFNNMTKLTEREILGLLKTAYKQQLAALGDRDPERAKTLKNRLNQLSS